MYFARLEERREYDTKKFLKTHKDYPKVNEKIYIPESKSYGMIKYYQYNDNNVPFVAIKWMAGTINSWFATELHYNAVTLKDCLIKRNWIILPEKE